MDFGVSLNLLGLVGQYYTMGAAENADVNQDESDTAGQRHWSVILG